MKGIKLDGVFNETEQEFLYEILPKIYDSITWSKLEIRKRLLVSDEIFKKEIDADLKHLILVADNIWQDRSYVVELNLSYKIKSGEAETKNYLRKLHRITVIVYRNYGRMVRRTICELSVNSRQKESRAYGILLSIFLDKWPDANVLKVTDQEKNTSALCAFNKMIKEL